MRSSASLKKLSLSFAFLLLGAFVWAANTSTKKKMSLKDLLGASSTSSKRGTTVAGVRGLDETGAGVDSKARDYAAVDRLDQVMVSEEDLKKFVFEGLLK